MVLRACGPTAVVLVIAASLAATAACSSTPSVEGEGPSAFTPKKTTTKKGSSTSSTGGSAQPEGDDTTETTSSSSGGRSPAGDAGGPAMTDAGGTTPPAGPCGNEATGSACFTCCETQNPAGLQVLQQAFGDCACNPQVTGNCSADCSTTWCAGVAASAACDNCLRAATTCEQQADAVCAANATCNAMLTCDTNSKCASKP